MTEQIPPNAARATLAAPLPQGATAVAVGTGQGALFVGPYPYMAVIGDPDANTVEEYVAVTARSGDTLTLVRAREGTADALRAAGRVIAAIFTRDGVARLLIDRTSYVHEQAIAASVWTIVHNLGFRPNVVARNSAGDIVEGEIDWPDGDTVVLTFSGGGFGGQAFLS